MLLIGSKWRSTHDPARRNSRQVCGRTEARFRTGRTLHLWFHPSNFYYRRDEQLATLAWMLERAANEAGQGRIEICTMDSHTAAPMSSCAPELQG